MNDEEQLESSGRTALRILDRRLPVTSGWRAPDVVRRIVVIRRRRRWTITALVVFLAAALTAVSLTGGSPRKSAEPVLHGTQRIGDRIDGAYQLVASTNPITRVDPSDVARVVDAEQKLSLALLQKLGHGANVSVSPASLYYALGMLQNGARGATAQQIASALQAGGLSTTTQNAGLAGWMAQLRAAAARDGLTLQSANSLWQQRGFPVRTQFLDELAAYYRTGVWQVDYQHDMSGALKAIDDWTSQQTHGKITKLFDSLDPSTVLVLANAIYFHAAWATPFDEGLTGPGTFTTGDGRTVQTKFMTSDTGLQAAVTGDYQAVQLPYRGGRFAALAVMPTHESLADFVAALSPAQISSMATKLQSASEVSLPRFTTVSRIDLKPVLQSLGMVQAFSDAADMRGLSRTPTKVDQVIQRVYLGVGEHGTTAAAVTGGSFIPLSGHIGPDVRLDHPFLFLVRDTKTGAILFASEIQDPTVG